MAFIFRFTTVKRGAIVITGNTLGLSKSNNANSPGNLDSIGGFITTSTTLPTPAAWAGIVNLANGENITLNWQENSSSAILNMLPGSIVVYAELIWAGVAITGNVDVTPFINNAIRFSTPVGTSLVSPNPITSVTLPGSGGVGLWYSNSQDVTSLVSASGAGKYTTGSVPSALNATNNSTNFAGWTLIVIYSNNALPARNMSVYSGAELVSQGSTVDTTVSGFITPPIGAITARILSCSAEGDAIRTGDYMQFGPSVASLTKLFGPNNPANPPNTLDNFFASQINIGDPNNVNVGSIDTTGTFGSRNSNAFTATNITAGRQGWDITNVNGSSALVNNQTSAVVRFATNSDVYMPNGLAIQIDTIFTDISVIKTDTPDPVIAGQNIEYTINISNAGPEDAKNVILTDTIPSQIITPQFSTDGGATWNTWTNPYSVGTVPNGASVDIKIRGTVNQSTTGTIANTATITTSTPDSDLTNNTSTTVTQVNTLADVLVTKIVKPDTASPGESITYTIDIFNNGPSQAQNVILTDTISNQILNQEFSVNGGSTWNPWVNPYNTGALSANSSKVILIRGTISQSTTDTITNTATVTSTTNDPNLNNNTSTADLTISPLAAVSVLKQATPNPVVAGTTITYTMLISNAGPADAKDITFVDTLPNVVLSPEFSTDGGSTWNTWISPYNAGTLPANNSQIVIIRGLVNSSSSGTIANTAIVSSSTPDQNLENNVSTVTVPITTLADISIIKQSLQNLVIAGDTITYSLSISNRGPSDAQNVILEDDIPSEILTPQISIDLGATWNPWINPYTVGNLSVGASQTALIRGKVNPSTTTTITNTVTISSSTTDPNPNDDVSTTNTPVGTLADISVEKLVNVNPVQAGTTLTYTMIISNQGLSDAQNVVLIDTIPSQILNPQFSINGGITWNTWINPYNVGTIPANNSKSVLIRGLVSQIATGALTNTAIVYSQTPDPDTQNNTSTLITGINNAADVSVLKTGTPNPVISGTTLTYTISVSNSGPNIAQNVVLIDTIPGQILNPQFSINQGSTWNPWTTPYNLGNLGISALQTILIRGIVNTLSTGQIINTAIVTTSTPDIDLSNNISQENTAINVLADVSVTKLASPNPVINGQILTYTIVASNSGPNNASNIILIDTVPNQVLNQEFSTDLGSTWNSWITPYSIGNLNVGISRTILIRGTVSSSATGSINNTAIVTSNTPEDNVTNNIAQTSTQVFNLADIQVTKIADLDKVDPGQVLTYTITITNNGPADSQGIILTDNVPSEILNPEFSINSGMTWNPWVSPYTIGDIVNGGSVDIKIRGTVDILAVGIIKNTAIVSAITPDPIPNNNISSVNTQTADTADLSVIKKESPLNINAGENILYTISILNNGINDAQNVVLIDTIPSQVLNQEFSTDGGSTWNPWSTPYSIGTIPNGSLINILIRGKTNPATPGTIANTAIVKSTTRDLNPSNNVFTVTTPINSLADIDVQKLSNPEMVVAGNILNYNLVIENGGPSDALDVVLTDTIPTQILNPEFSIDSGSTWNPWISPYTIGTIPASGVISIKIRGIVNPAYVGTIANTAITSSKTLDPDVEDSISTVTTPVTALSDLSVEKLPDKNTPVAGENITYTVSALNIGPSVAQNVVLVDTVPSCILGPQYSLDGINFTPWLGSIGLGNLGVSAKTTVYIKGLVDPSCTGILDNTAVVSSTTPDPNPVNNTSTSTIPINTLSDIRVTKDSNPNPVIAGQQIGYTISISNSGPSDAKDVILTDALPAQILNPEYLLNGIGSWNPWISPINLGTLAKGTTSTVQIRGIISPDSTGSILNTATVGSITPFVNPFTATTIATTYIMNVSLAKSVDKLFAEPEEEITYTFTINNQSGVSISNVYLYDPLPLNTTFVSGSFSLNPTQNPTIAPGALISSIPANTPTTASFRVKINSNLTSAVNIPDTGSVTYNYKLNPNDPDIPAGPINSNLVNTQVEIPQIQVLKSQSTNNVEVGDVVTYTLTVQNTGTVNAYDVEVIDILPPELQFVPGTLVVVPQQVGDIVTGTSPSYVKISIIRNNPNVATIQFNATVISRPSSGKITNNASANFKYSLNPQEPPTLSKQNILSNTTTTNVESINVEITKTANSTYVEVGKELTYTIQINNKSTVPVDIKFTDTLPNTTQYVGGSFNLINGGFATVVNNTPSNATVIDVDITSMLPQSVVIFSYRINVLSLPLPPSEPKITNNASATPSYRLYSGGPVRQGVPVSDSVTTDVKLIKIDVTKTVNENIARVGDILHYTVLVVNNGNTIAQNVLFNDNIPFGGEFVLNSMKINGTSTSYRPDQNTNIGNIIPGQIVTVEFDVKVVSIPPPPSKQELENIASVLFEIELGGQLQPQSAVFSNIVNTELVNINLVAVKTVDKINVKIGDTLTYAVVITNNSDIAIDNVIFTDSIPNGTTLVGSQQVINVNLGTIQPKESKTVTFMVKVTSKPCPPKLTNKATVTGSYLLQTQTITILQTQNSITIESNEVSSYVDVKIFKQFSIDTTVKIPPQKPEAEDILEIISNIEIIDTYLVKIPIVTSYEGQILTGWKLIVEGIIREKVVYIAEEPAQSVHAAEFEIPFSTFIMLPKDYNNCRKIRITSILENNCYSLSDDKRTISQSLTMMIKAII